MSENARFFDCPYDASIGQNIDDKTFQRDLCAAIGIMSPAPTPRPLIRIGGNADGAYLLPDDLDGIEACFSPGVNNRKDFEDELAQRFGIKSHMCDYTSDVSKLKTPIITGMQTFKKLWLDISGNDDALTLSDWIAELAAPSDDLMLQIDIEGAEYRNLLNCTDQILSRFRIICIELHSLNKMLDRAIFYGVIFPLLKKINNSFVCIHAHPNNNVGVFYVPETEINVPNVIELTLLRRDRIASCNPTDMMNPLVPHPLDIMNVKSRKAIVLSDFWLSGKERSLESRFKIFGDELMFLSNSADKMRSELMDVIQATLDLLPTGFENSSEEGEQRSLDEHLKEVAAGAKYTVSSVWGGGAKTGIIPHSAAESYFFHTDVAPNQSILLDLGEVRNIRKLEIYNRIGAAGERAKFLFANLSRNLASEKRHVCRLPPNAGFIAGKEPSIKYFSPAVEARYVKISSPLLTALHFSMIKIFAEP